MAQIVEEEIPKPTTEYFEVFGVLVPVHPDEADNQKYFIVKFHNAFSHEIKLREKCALKCTKVGKFKKIGKTYLSNKRVLLVAMFRDNAKRKLPHRLSLAQMHKAAMKYKVLKCLNEPVNVSVVPKSSGNGTRTIQSFGPVARAAQRMVVTLLRMTFKPKYCQFPHYGSPEKVEHAMSLITTKGYNHVLEIDIIQFYPSFTEEELTATLPLPTEAVKQIVMATSALRVSPHGYNAFNNNTPTPSGIPQGSASSSEIDLWCVAHLKLAKIKDIELVNHADNFFVFAKSKAALEKASKALSSGIAGLPGGKFKGRVQQKTTADAGFKMLGCWLHLQNGELTADPTEANLQKLMDKFRIGCQRVHAKLKAADDDNDKNLRLEGLQDFLRLRNLVDGWVSAFAFCGPLIECVKDDLLWYLTNMCRTYDITKDELAAVDDRSTKVVVGFYSG